MIAAAWGRWARRHWRNPGNSRSPPTPPALTRPQPLPPQCRVGQPHQAAMDKSLLVRVFGFPATLVHGDTLVLDRWRWLKNRLPLTANGERLLDVGCGTGAFTIGAARRGYRALGLSWDERNQATAQYRAELCRTPGASFDVLDVRRLDTRSDLRDAFDVALCLECVEHILDDRKLIRDIAACLKPGGRLLLTTPNYDYRAITREDNGPFALAETGWHVRRGYT